MNSDLSQLPDLTEEEESIYAWQIPIHGFGAIGQRRLKAASVLISRVGGLGGMVAMQLAAAGIGRLLLAHGGNIQPSDLNRQLLMTHAGIGQSRMDSIVRRLHDLNPRLDLVAVPRNVGEDNALELVEQADLVVDCAPLFSERYALNAAALKLRKPMVEAAMHDTEFHLTTFVPGQTPCLRCLYPEPSTTWTRRFPVFGAVSGAAGAMAAMEAIKYLAGFGKPLTGRMLIADLRSQEFRNLNIRRLPNCPDCGTLTSK